MLSKPFIRFIFILISLTFLLLFLSSILGVKNSIPQSKNYPNFFKKDCLFIADYNEKKATKSNKTWFLVDLKYENDAWEVLGQPLEDFLSQKISSPIIFSTKKDVSILFLSSLISAFEKKPPKFPFLFLSQSYRFTESLKKEKADWLFGTDEVVNIKINLFSSLGLESFLDLNRDFFILKFENGSWNFSLKALKFLNKRQRKIFIEAGKDFKSDFKGLIDGQVQFEDSHSFTNPLLVSRCQSEIKD